MMGGQGNLSIMVLGVGAVIICLLPTPSSSSPLIPARRHHTSHLQQKRSILDASPVEPWGEIFSSEAECHKALRMMPQNPLKHQVYGTRKCEALWDGVLCWPETPAGTTVYQSCPNMAGLDPQNFAERQCLDDGSWAGQPKLNSVGPRGWTDYRPCYTPYARALYEKYYGDLKK